MIISLKVEDELGKLSRRMDDLKKTIDTLYQDREILEDIQGRLTALEEQSRLTRQHDIESKKDIKYEINKAGDKTAAKVETGIQQVQAIIESGKTVKKVKKNLLEKIKSGLKVG
jgi:hypothetical protein